MQLEKILYERFGYTTFRKGQREIVESVLNKENVVAMLPTGAGKSLCYLLPGYAMKGTVLIVSPLLSLMEDQVQQLQMIGEKRVVAINSFLSYEEKLSTIHELEKYKFIYVSPEMLQTRTMLQKLKQLRIALFVIDEAHCISQWGHEFRTDYLKLNEVVQEIGAPPVLALTATATEKVVHDIVNSLKLTDVKYHLHSVDRPNIALHVDKLETIEDKKRKLLEWVTTLQGPGIIYFSSRYWTEHICSFLKQHGVEGIAFYHGGMESGERLLIQQQFLNDQIQLICCTNAFGMGVNKPNVRYVIHFHYPSHMEAYLQEIGRAGRDGENSIAILLASPTDQELPQALIQQEFPARDELEHVLHYLNESMEQHESVNEATLLAHTTLTETKWRFIRYQLEVNGWMKGTTVLRMLDVEPIASTIEQFIQKRLQYKHKKLNEMRKWIDTPICRREAYLSIFNEELIKPIPQCCDHCSLEYSWYVKKANYKKERTIEDWRRELQAILLKVGGDDEKSG